MGEEEEDFTGWTKVKKIQEEIKGEKFGGVTR